jgi:hypothetical protein
MSRRLRHWTECAAHLNGCIQATRLANLREVAKTLGKPTVHVQPRMRLQRW